MAEKYIYTRNREGLIITYILFGFYIFISCVSIAETILQTIFMTHLVNSDPIDTEDLLNLIHFRQSLASYTIIIYIACRSLFLNWAYYAQLNARYFHIEGLKFDVWKLIFGFIIPIANFVLPIVLINQIWHASDPNVNSVEDFQKQKVSKFIVCWWSLNLFWIFFSIWNNIMKVSTTNFVVIRNMIALTAVGDLMGIIVMIWSGFIMLKIYRRQQEKHRRMEGAGR